MLLAFQHADRFGLADAQGQAFGDRKLQLSVFWADKANYHVLPNSNRGVLQPGG